MNTTFPCLGLVLFGFVFAAYVEFQWYFIHVFTSLETEKGNYDQTL